MSQKGNGWMQIATRRLENVQNLVKTIDIGVFTSCETCRKPFQPLQLQCLVVMDEAVWVTHPGSCREGLAAALELRRQLAEQDEQ